MKSDEFVSALLELVAWYKRHPDMPAPPTHTFYVMPGATEVERIARACGGFKKTHDDNWANLRRDFGGIALEFCFARDQVCTKRVVGTEEVPEQIIPAYTREIAEWDCHPLLRPEREESAS